MRMLSGRTLGGYDLPCEGKTLAALGATAERRIGAGRATGAIAAGLAHVIFPDGIANADNHAARLPDDSAIALMRTSRNTLSPILADDELQTGPCGINGTHFDVDET